MESIDHDPATALGARRVPWRAALLGLAAAGLGQLYCGRPRRAFLLFALALICGLLWLSVLFIPVKPWNIVAFLSGLVAIWLLTIWDAVHCARSAPPNYSLKAYNRWYVYLLIIILAGLIPDAVTPVLRNNFLQAFKIPNGSMSPAVMQGDHLIVNRRAYLQGTPQRGDVVAFRSPQDGTTLFMKRVVGVGGDVIRIANRKVYVNGTLLAEPYVHFTYETSSLPLRDNFPPAAADVGNFTDASGLAAAWAKEMPQHIQADGLHIPLGVYFLLGDMRDNSLDSRFYGFVKAQSILGKARVIYFSWDGESNYVRWERIGQIVH